MTKNWERLKNELILRDYSIKRDARKRKWQQGDKCKCLEDIEKDVLYSHRPQLLAGIRAQQAKRKQAGKTYSDRTERTMCYALPSRPGSAEYWHLCHKEKAFSRNGWTRTNNDWNPNWLHIGFGLLAKPVLARVGTKTAGDIIRIRAPQDPRTQPTYII